MTDRTTDRMTNTMTDKQNRSHALTDVMMKSTQQKTQLFPPK